MADWLKITNTFIDIETKQRVGNLSRAQQQIANLTMAIEPCKQIDSALLSRRFDVVRQDLVVTTRPTAFRYERNSYCENKKYRATNNIERHRFAVNSFCGHFYMPAIPRRSNVVELAKADRVAV